MMAETKTITERLIEVQKKLVAPKSNYNNFGKYKYRSAEDILEAVKPLNAENGLLLTISDEPLLIGDWHYIKATASITDGKDTHEVTAYARESQTKKGMDDSQITGTASSYARKYALNGLYLIDDTKDADTDEYQSQNGNQQTNERTANDKQMKLLHFKVGELAKAYNMPADKVKSQLKVTDNMKEVDFKAALKRAQDGLDKVQAENNTQGSNQ